MKFTYTPLVNLNNQSSAVANINNNMAAIQTAMEKTLSRDGTSPNAMQSSLDMNGNHILNLPTPTQSTDAVRLQDITGPVSIITNSNIIYYNILDYIPVNLHAAIQAYTSTSDVTSYINTAISAVNATGGVLLFPRGRYYITSTIGQANLRNITLLGVGGKDLFYFANSGTVFYFTGSGSGNIFNFTDGRGITCDNFQVVYTSGSFSGTCFDCSTATPSGSGNTFNRIQFYKQGFAPFTCARVWYLKNNVDVYFKECLIAHSINPWVGLEDGDTGENNVITVEKCTTIANVGHAIVNPTTGWSIISSNFELGYNNIPSGIEVTTNKHAKNLNLISCIFADATVGGTWIDIRNVHGFTMHGGSINGFTLGSGGKCIKLSGVFNSGISITGVLFEGMDVGVDFASTCYGVTLVGNTFLNVTTELMNTSNIDSGSIVLGNHPYTINLPLNSTMGGTGTTTSTGTGFNVLNASPAFTGFPTFADTPTFNNGIISKNNSYFKTRAGGDIAAVIFDTDASGEAVGFTFQDNSTTKWSLYKDAFHNFYLFDFVAGVIAVSASSFLQTITVGYTTTSTSTTTGSLVNSGGLGNAGPGYFGGSITSNANTAIPAGGTTGSGLKVSSTSDFGIFFGSGAPTLSAAKGSLYLRSDGSSTSTRMYVNTDGTTGWTAVTTAT